MTHPNQNFAENLKCMDQSRKLLSDKISIHRNHEDMHLLSTNMNVICTVSILCVALLNGNQNIHHITPFAASERKTENQNKKQKRRRKNVLKANTNINPFIHPHSSHLKHIWSERHKKKKN